MAIVKKDRIDKMLVYKGLVETRSKALLLIEEGVIYSHGNLVTKASMVVDEFELVVKKEIQYVSRGAHKIEGALKLFNQDVAGKIIADVGASTGGFTEYVLEKGAAKVYAIDVGHDQLAKKLRDDDRVINLEGVNIKFPYELPEKVDLAVVDLSFISLKLVLKNIHQLLKEGGFVIALVKPQFEVGSKGLNKNGVVKTEELRLKALLDVREWCEENKIKVIDECLCSIQGKNGNQESFFLLKNNNKKSLCVFCGSSQGEDPFYLEQAKAIGMHIAKNNWRLVYGGATIGVMGALANSVLQHSGEVVGVIPKHLVDYEIAHDQLTELIIVPDMHLRKKKMYELSDGFLALPGGLGTLDEMFEILTWGQLNLHQKPCFLLNEKNQGKGFYDFLVAHLNRIHEEGFMKKEHLELLKVLNSMEEIANDF